MEPAHAGEELDDPIRAAPVRVVPLAHSSRLLELRFEEE